MKNPLKKNEEDFFYGVNKKRNRFSYIDSVSISLQSSLIHHDFYKGLFCIFIECSAGCETIFFLEIFDRLNRRQTHRSISTDLHISGILENGL